MGIVTSAAAIPVKAGGLAFKTGVSAGKKVFFDTPIDAAVETGGFVLDGCKRMTNFTTKVVGMDGLAK